MSEDAQAIVTSHTADAAQAERANSTATSPADTWGPVAPPLRLTRRPRRQGTPLGALPSAAPVSSFLDPPPAGLRVLRAAAGLGLLVLAWAGVLGMVLLAQSLRADMPQVQRIAPTALVLFVVECSSILWLLVCVCACLVGGAFCLSLALLRRRW